MNSRQVMIISGLMLAGLAICILAGVLVFTQDGAFPLAGLFDSDQPVVRIFIQSPPLSAVDEEIMIVVTISNLTENYIQVDEIRLPQTLLDAAIVTAVIPGTITQTNYGDMMGFQIGFVLAPGGSQSFEITLRTLNEADVMGQIQVAAGTKMAESGFRMVINQALAVGPTATETPTVTPSATPTLEPTLTPTATPVIIPYQAVVKIIAKIKTSSRLRQAWIGSGTIVSPDGLILTNAHVADPEAPIKADAMIIAFTDNPAQSPEERYLAKVLVVDHDLDLAVMVIDTDLKYKAVDRSTLNLPFMSLGNSDTVQLGDPLTILGYPGIGGETITLTYGEVGGFTSEKKFGDRAFIKTAANITGGTSGGLGMDRLGYMVGIPTQLGNGQGGGDLLDCRVLVDTNGDGNVNQRDQCVPVGGFINALRPINLALPLIEEAKQIAK